MSINRISKNKSKNSIKMKAGIIFTLLIMLSSISVSRAEDGYIVITTQAIKNGANATFLAFKAHKESLGYEVKMITEGATEDDLHYLPGNNGDQRANNIREWLQNRYEGIRYVLLIGNPDPLRFDTDYSIPMKICQPFDSGADSGKEFPTDAFYAEMTVEGNWDKNQDLRVGDYGADWELSEQFELSVGRIPYYQQYSDSVDRLERILQKIVDYELAEDQEWRKKMLIAAAIINHAPMDINVDGVADSNVPCQGDACEYEKPEQRTFSADWGEALKKLAETNDYKAYSLYEGEGCSVQDGCPEGSAYPMEGFDKKLTETNFLSEWENHYGLVVWHGHGSSRSVYRRVWEHDTFQNNDVSPNDNIAQYVIGSSNISEIKSVPFLTASNITQLHDAYPSFVLQASCSTGYPENEKNLAYTLLSHGAIATVAGTRPVKGYEGVWKDEYKGYPHSYDSTYMYHIAEKMIEENSSIGDALLAAKNSFWNNGQNKLSFNLYGDPSLSIILNNETQSNTLGCECPEISVSQFQRGQWIRPTGFNIPTMAFSAGAISDVVGRVSQDMIGRILCSCSVASSISGNAHDYYKVEWRNIPNNWTGSQTPPYIGWLSSQYISDVCAFNDVANIGSYHREAISSLCKLGIVHGDGAQVGSFLPNNNIIRAEFSKMVVESIDAVAQPDRVYLNENNYLPSSGQGYTDVPNFEWYYDYVYRASQEARINNIENSYAIVHGYSDSITGEPTGEFGPQNPILLPEMIKMVMEGFFDDRNLTTDYNSQCQGAPSEQLWSCPYIEFAQDEGIRPLCQDENCTSVSNGSVRPSARKETAKALWDAIQNYIILITPENGGTVNFPDSREILLKFPVNAVSKNVKVSVKTIGITDAPPVKGGLRLVGNAYEVLALDMFGVPVTEFDEEIQISLVYNSRDLNGMSPQDLRINFYNESAGTWEQLPSLNPVNTVNRTVTAVTDHFTKFAILAPTHIPGIEPTQTPVSNVPEPTTALLLGVGLAAFIIIKRKFKR